MLAETIRNANHYIGETVTASSLLALGGLAAYFKLRPERCRDLGENYFDIIADLDSRIMSAVGDEIGYAMVGGGTSAALMNPKTIYDLEKKLVIPPSDIRKDQFRPENGTLADVDILVFTDDNTIIDQIKSSLIPNFAVNDDVNKDSYKAELSKPGAKLKIGITGFVSRAEYDSVHQTKNRKYLLNILKKDWVSQRLLNSDSSCTFAISDIKVGLPDEYFDPWLLVLNNGNTIRILHPLLHVLCYPARASHGVRPRDKSKIVKMMDNIGEIFNTKVVWGDNDRTVNLIADESLNAGVKAAIEFNRQKNDLRWEKTKARLPISEAAILSARIAIHRQLDTRKIFIQFGQGGWLYDNIFSRFSNESQTSIKY